MRNFINLLGIFVWGYPFIMSLMWISGGIFFFRSKERNKANIEELPQFSGEVPAVTILIPCHNEGDNVRETIKAAMEQNYSGPLEVIAINDGSTDDTAEHLTDLLKEYPLLRVIHLHTNQGKSSALKAGVLASKSEFLVCIDGDALLDEYSTYWLVYSLNQSENIGTVTGNPRIRNRSTILGKLQVGEFSSIIGLIKRAQRTYGRIFTVSGVIAGFRRSALNDVEYWSETIVTDDIDITWRLQINRWAAIYEPRAIASILMPETVRGLWKQRLRWAKGGAQVIREHTQNLVGWRKKAMWPVFWEFLVSSLWAYSALLLTVLIVCDVFTPLKFYGGNGSLYPTYSVASIFFICLLQFAVSVFIDRRYEDKTGRLYYWIIWYPIVYWLLNMMTTVVAIPQVVFEKKNKRAIWISPDRGVR